MSLLVLGLACAGGGAGRAAESGAGTASTVAPASTAARVLEVAGVVEVRTQGTVPWVTAAVGGTLRVGDRVRTGPGSRAAVQLTDRSVFRMGPASTLEIQAPRAAGKARFGLLEGLLFFFDREKPADIEFETPLASGAIRGTEFVLAAAGQAGATELALLDGRVDLEASGTTVALASGERGRVEPGGGPTKSPLLEARRVVQWALYYPAVLAPEDLALGPADTSALEESLAAYRSGDLLAARAAAGRMNADTPARRLYRAALELAVGDVPAAEALLVGVAGDVPVARALRELIAVVRDGAGAESEPATASEWLARSYAWQRRYRLAEARAAARRAVELAPESGFARVRLAELEFALEDRRAALAELDRATALAPRLASAPALRGFVLLERNRPAEARAEFDRALALDAGLGSAWLGRGLALLRLRERDEALRALETAAALDPRRAEHRAYLGKGFAERGEAELARKEYRLARDLDSADPTAWLYSALLEWEENRPNRAVSDLEQSVALNDNRQVFRSRLGLDRDLAVRRADLAAVYRDAGLFEVSRRSASRAVVDDYANFAGHLFLANSYQEVEDPGRFDLRYETTRVSELLLANLLAPPSGANLSQRVSQQEHLQMFDGRPFGANSYTEYRSGGDWRQEASFFGSLDGFAYALDTAFVWENGTGGNTERERSDVSLQLKQQVGERDDVYLQLAFMGAEAGDVARHHDPAEAKPDFHVEEEQVPNLHLGWHRAWTPDSHTLLLFSRLTDRLELHDGQPEVLFLRQRDGGTASVSTPPFFDLRYESRFTLYSAEVQQLWQWEDHEVIAGVRGQAGTIEPEAWLDRPAGVPVTAQAFDDPLRRVTAYFYDHWRLTEWLRLVAGVSYDRLTHPLNSESAPLTEGDVTRDLVAPKAGLVVTPWKDGLVRGSYTRSLGGVYFDNSVRLEPTQVAGFNQAFRSLLPESVAGLVPGTEFETFGVGIDQKLGPVHFGVEAEWLQSTGDRLVGALTNSLPLPVPDSASGTRQELDFREGSVAAYAVVLIGDGLSLGARYRLSEATYEERFPGIPTGAAGRERLESDVRAVLQQATMSAGYLHASGAFFRWETQWFAQENDGYVPALAGDDFWQHDVWVGYRWPRRRAEIRAGVLNLTDTDYRLNPLNAWPALPRERTAVVSLRLNF